MAARATNFKLEEEKIMDIKNVASVFNKTMTDVLNEALDAYLFKIKQDPFYRLSCNVKEASEEESKEVLEALDSLSDDDLEIASIEKISL